MSDAATRMPSEFEEFFQDYMACLLWQAPEGDDGKELDDTHTVSDFSADSAASSRKDCADFFSANEAMLKDVCERPGYSWGQAGHDFCLTRNHHGAGFWDRGLGQAGRVLTLSSHTYGSAGVYVGDDGKLYV